MLISNNNYLYTIQSHKSTTVFYEYHIILHTVMQEMNRPQLGKEPSIYLNKTLLYNLKLPIESFMLVIKVKKTCFSKKRIINKQYKFNKNNRCVHYLYTY